MKTKILSELKTKFDGVEENILERMANKLAKTVTTDEGVKTAVEGVTFQTLLTSYGDFRANESQESAVKNYEKKYNLKDGKTVKSDTGDDVHHDEPEWFKAYREKQEAEMAKLKADAEKHQLETKQAERSKLISDTAKELGIPSYLVKHLNLKDDADVKAELTSFKQELVTNNLPLETSGGFLGTEEGAIKSEAEAFADSLPDKV